MAFPSWSVTFSRLLLFAAVVCLGVWAYLERTREPAAPREPDVRRLLRDYWRAQDAASLHGAAPAGHTYGPILLTAARLSSDRQAAYRALITVMTGPDFLLGHRVDAARLLATRYSDQIEHLTQVLISLSGQRRFDAAPVLREFIRHAKERVALRAVAMYALAEWLAERPDLNEATREELVHLLQFASRHGTEVPHPVFPGLTIADVATALLREHVELAQGQVAPAIEGFDLQGRPMRLEDFRGKLVVLYFWGDW